MDYLFREILENVVKRIDAIYLINLNDDTYKMLKDNEVFHLVFGDNGSYSEMVESILENTVDRLVSKGTTYGVFLESTGKFKGTIANLAKIRSGDRKINISLTTFLVNDVQIVLVINIIDNEEAIKAFEAIQQTNDVVKTAYLFTMNIDLVTNKCENYSMSEVEDMPAFQKEISYTYWRDMIVNMFPTEDKKVFLSISNPLYLHKHLHYNRAISAECQMMNLEGEYIWVRLIFNRINTGNDNEFRAVFMVENIHKVTIQLLNKFNISDIINF
ncbi:MAG: hypothetical protein E6Z86_17770 [Clostridium butyricum]|nr:hypothetical protein [Clostridium butyricum]MDU5820958.1 hypothetical protein [Clostridium butyricum]